MKSKTLFLYALVLGGLATTPALSEKNVMTFQDGGRSITSSTSCNPMNWRGNDVNACMCCVIKHAPYEWMSSINKNVANNITNDCNKYCINSVIQKTKAQLNVPPKKSLYDVYHEILKNNTSIQYVKMTDFIGRSDANQLTNGNLTEQGVSLLLQRIRSSENTTNKLKDILGQGKFAIQEIKGEGGAQTLQLFLIRDAETGTPKFVLKGLKKSLEEIENIETIRHSALGSLTYDPSVEPIKGFPALALDVHNFTYKDRKGNSHDMALINCAPGKDVRKFIHDWTQSETPDPQAKVTAGKVAYRMGNNIAYIHRKFNQEPNVIMGKTYTHGDMHPHNVFYDPVYDRIIFIDNESFALSIINPRDPSVDIMKFYGRLVATNYKEKHQYRYNIPGNEYYQSIVKPFILGYVDGYAGNDVQKRRKVFLKLRDIMTNQSAFKTWLDNNKSLMNPVELYHNQQKYAKPLFDELWKEKFSGKGTSGLKAIMADATYWP